MGNNIIHTYVCLERKLKSIHGVPHQGSEVLQEPPLAGLQHACRHLGHCGNIGGFQQWRSLLLIPGLIEDVLENLWWLTGTCSMHPGVIWLGPDVKSEWGWGCGVEAWC